MTLKAQNSASECDMRQTNTGRLLLTAMRAFNERSMLAVREMGHQALSFAHAAILLHIGTEGTISPTSQPVPACASNPPLISSED